tara:strand:+ start:442 stop:1374 length:933 start_codon:yes stop_codon:yes gene_type:complete
MRTHLIDNPSARSSHRIPTPRGGGLAIVLAFSLSVLLWFFWSGTFAHILLYILVFSWVIAALGFIDDLYSLSAKLRLLIQLVLALFLTICIISPFKNGSNIYLDCLVIGVVIFLIIWFVNLYNFMDGIDGLAATECIFVALAAVSILFINSSHSLMLVPMIILATSSLGFVLWNFPPAKIFMGDIGSGFIGFVFAAFIVYSVAHKEVSIFAWLIWLSVFLCDATYTLCYRITHKCSPFQPHCTHAYQILAKKWGSHKKVLFSILYYNVFWLYPLGWLASEYMQYRWVFLLAAFIPGITICLIVKAGVSSE